MRAYPIITDGIQIKIILQSFKSAENLYSIFAFDVAILFQGDHDSKYKFNLN